MLSDDEVREAFCYVDQGLSVAVAARRLCRSPGAVRKYVNSRKLPSQTKQPRTYRTRTDPFEDVWPELREHLEQSPALQAKTLFEDLCRRHPGRYQEGQLRTLQRKISAWRALHGPDKEVFFDQVHHPAQRAQSDWTEMDALEITIARQPFPHLLYHFALTYSNWEYAEIAVSESYLSLQQGLQNALWHLGGAPAQHRTDNTSAATHDLRFKRGRDFNRRYLDLVGHYGLEPTTNNVGKGHENGDVEKSHDLFKTAVDQELLLRGTRDFPTRAAYEAFLRDLLARRNARRSERLAQEQPLLKPLPARRLDDFEEEDSKVSRGSTIAVRRNRYSVPARLIGKRVRARVWADRIEVFFKGHKVESFPRLPGSGQARIQYRHVIRWLVRKPRAFADYRHRDELFPRLAFRRAYDRLRKASPASADLEYLRVLKLAAEVSEERVCAALEDLLERGQLPDSEAVRAAVAPRPPKRPHVAVRQPELRSYDALLSVTLPQSAAAGDRATEAEGGGGSHERDKGSKEQDPLTDGE